jgi:hypothetical protein
MKKISSIMKKRLKKPEFTSSVYFVFASTIIVNFILTYLIYMRLI